MQPDEPTIKQQGWKMIFKGQRGCLPKFRGGASIRNENSVPLAARRRAPEAADTKKFGRAALAAGGVAVSLAAMAVRPAQAFELGYPGWSTPPGVTIGAVANPPPPGVYSFNQVYAAQAVSVTPSGPSAVMVNTETETNGLIFVPGWTVLGGRYDAVLVQPFATTAASSTPPVVKNGIHNTFLAPINLSWTLGRTGLHVQTGFGFAVPDGSMSGATALGGMGNPWWTFSPDVMVSYLQDHFNLTANVYSEINTQNALTHYTSGTVLHADFTAVRHFGQWTVGPVASYVGQITGDTSSAYYKYAINVNRYDIWSAGGLVGYDFGPVVLNVWGTNDVAVGVEGGKTASISSGFRLYAGLNFKI
jgi:hypothetical protein